MSEGTEAAAPAKAKSIVDSKYRDKYKNAEKDFVAQGLADNGSAVKTVKGKELKNAEGKVTGVEPDREIVTGVDVEKLFTIASDNNLDVAKYRSQVGGHGFAGRFRMTLANMLRAAAKQRHGLFFGGHWVPAPAEWLTEKGAPEKATHNQDGSKIPVAKVEKPKAEAKASDTPATPAASEMTEAQKAALRANVAKGKGPKK